MNGAGRYTWEADAASPKCWVVYQTAGKYTRLSVLTVWGTTPVELSGDSMRVRHIRDLVLTTVELMGHVSDDLMDAVCVTLELMG